MATVSLHNTLPVELFHRILDYCDVQTIVLSVRGICQRLYALVNAYDRFKRIINSKSLSIFLSICRFIQPDVITFEISNRRIDPYLIYTFVSHFDSHRLTTLRSLTLHDVNYINLDDLYNISVPSP
jgi:hypothetical protein